MAGQLVGRHDTPALVGAEASREPGTGNVRSSLLSRAGMLLGTSLDTGRTLAAIAELLVPSFADQCIVDLLDDSGALRRAVTVRVDHKRNRRTSSPSVADRRVAYPDDHPCAIALRTGRPALARAERPVAPPAPVPRPANGNHPMLMDAAAVIAVPLLGPRGIKGVLAVAADGPDGDFDEGDVELVEEVAARAGFALENAALYESMRSLALALQHSLLPAHLPSIDGVAVQVGYNPGDESDVGGDLYDVMELSSGRIGIAIGDVQGRGAHAAAVMGQLRAALRAYAVLDLEPAQVLTHLDDLVQGLNEALLVTCVYAIYDPFTRECVLANAGHPPPLLTGAHGCHPMEVPPDVPLGVGGIAFTDHAFKVAPGDTVVLYTDGVVERRDQSVDQGVRALCDALEAIGPSPTPAALCRATLRASSGPLDDDRAVLAMRTDLDPLPLWRIDLPADPASPSVARAHARALLREWSAESLAETVELLVSELVTNAVRHASGPGPTPRGPVFDADSEFELDRAQDGTLAAEDGELDLAALERVLLGDTAPDGLLDNAVLDGAVAALRNDRRIEVVMRRGRASLWVEVHDQDVRTPRVRTASANDEGGRGLFLVDQLSRRWGVRATPTGKAVWFQLPLRG
ncbi:MAG TPA: SpoIIE family protein phosphatase [Actinocrinis sp.]|jgi:GAF domain-containing protein|uniref:ATP-binding SpoIIE family protein phosphatase n=1 Tax=Actinocrinis sp. TaxID=1920516 RepID=UPI002DDCDAB9|nr:SpoIIE family protein phosphatase [Actinocrinis sp.]HEV3172453.1 SpoIIE family protein phosphatase [Actinocrinis sp.]